MRRTLPLLLLTVALSTAHAITVDAIVKGSRKVLDGVNDFTCIMTFTVRSADMRVPPSRVKIYFKKPDKFKPEAIDGDFAVLPNTYHFAIGNVLERMLEDHDATVLRDEVVKGRDTWVLQLTPQEDDTPIGRHLVYVDQQQYTLNRITTYPRNDKPLTLSTTYKKIGKAYLPAEANIDGYTRRKRRGEETVEEVHIRLVWDQYKINVGLKDSLFENGK